MTEIRKILVCSDMSSASDHALARAALLAQAFSADCLVVHATNINSGLVYSEFDVGLAPLEDQVREEAERRLDEQIARCWPKGVVRPKAVVLSGNPVALIPDHALSVHADLVVLGSHGAGFLEKLFLGTTATRLIKRLTMPTLVVRTQPQGHYRRFLVPVDFSSYSEKTLQSVKRIAPSASIVLMHAFESFFEGQMTHAGVDEATIHRYRIAARDEAARKIQALAQRVGLSPQDYTSLLAHGRAYKEILAAEASQRVDCIAMGKQGQGFVNELLLGSMTKHVLLEAQSDVLVQPA
jgi:nucleotide-binding universal stress UspA family protein